MKLTTDRAAMRLSLMAFMALASLSAHALTIKMSDGANTKSTPKITCRRDNDGDQCWVTATIGTSPQSVRSGDSPIFKTAFDNWKGVNAGWSMEDGGKLEGEIEITEFRPYNDCPSNAGVQIQAFFHPRGRDPLDLKWTQGLFAPPSNAPHNGPAVNPTSYMDCNIPAAKRQEAPPLYPFSYANKMFWDKPGRQCVDNTDVTWSAVCLLGKVSGTKLTTYQGFGYGFTVSCRPVPEPASIATLGIGVICLLRRRTRARAG